MKTELIEQKVTKGDPSSLGSSDAASAARGAAAKKVKVELMEVGIGEVAPDPEQPRKTFAAEKLQELADSLKAQGMLQPMLARRLSDRSGKAGNPSSRGSSDAARYVIVDGERRWRAAKVAGLERVPILVGEYEELLAIQVSSNQQRENLSALEEAAAFRKEIESGRHTAESLYKELGVSRAHLFGRLRLNNLKGEGLKALQAGTISPSVAGLVVMVPEKQQEEFLKDCTGDKYNAALSFRDAQELLERQYCKQLKDATFDLKDAELVPPEWEVSNGTMKRSFNGRAPVIPESRKAYAGSRTEDDGQGHKKTVCSVWAGERGGNGKSELLADNLTKPQADDLVLMIQEKGRVRVTRLRGGACEDCPYRTGNIPDPELAKRPNVCTQPACFAMKERRALEAIVAAAKLAGKKVLGPEESKKLFGTYQPTQLEYSAPYVFPGAACEWAKNGMPYKDALGSLKEEVWALNGNGKLVALWPKEAVRTAMKEKGMKAPVERDSSASYHAEQKKWTEKVARTKAVVEVAMKGLIEAVAKRPAWGKMEWRLLAGTVCWSNSRYRDKYQLGHSYGGNEKKFEEHFNRMSEAALRVAVAEAEFCDRTVTDDGDLDPRFKEVCQVWGVKIQPAEKAAEDSRTPKPAAPDRKDKAKAALVKNAKARWEKAKARLRSDAPTRQAKAKGKKKGGK